MAVPEGAQPDCQDPLQVVTRVSSCISEDAEPLRSHELDCEQVEEGPLWEAVLWKRSRYLGIWRQRNLRLDQCAASDCWRLTSREPGTGAVTDSWDVSKEEAVSADLEPQAGFADAFLLNDVALAAESDGDARALRELRELVGHKTKADVRESSLGSSGSTSLPSSGCPTPRSSRCTTAQCSPQMEPLPGEDCVPDLTLDEGPPICQCCCTEKAKGQVIGTPHASRAVAQWLCKDCFVTSWTQIASDDGRWKVLPRWLLLLEDRSLRDATPPQMRRYGRVCRR